MRGTPWILLSSLLCACSQAPERSLADTSAPVSVEREVQAPPPRSLPNPCEITVPDQVTVVRGTAVVGAGVGRYLVCEGAELKATGGRIAVYARPGSDVELRGALADVWVEAGAVVSSEQGEVSILAADLADLTLGKGVLFSETCASLALVGAPEDC